MPRKFYKVDAGQCACPHRTDLHGDLGCEGKVVAFIEIMNETAGTEFVPVAKKCNCKATYESITEKLSMARITA